MTLPFSQSRTILQTLSDRFILRLIVWSEIAIALMA
jgi:hypothetical protein